MLNFIVFKRLFLGKVVIAQIHVFLLVCFLGEGDKVQCFHCGGGHGNPVQYSCLENPMDRGA